MGFSCVLLYFSKFVCFFVCKKKRKKKRHFFLSNKHISKKKFILFCSFLVFSKEETNVELSYETVFHNWTNWLASSFSSSFLFFFSKTTCFEIKKEKDQLKQRVAFLNIQIKTIITIMLKIMMMVIIILSKRH